MKGRLQQGKVILFVFLVIGNMLLQTGCGFKDIDKRIFVMAIGIDKAEDQAEKYKVTLKMAVPSGSLKEASGGNMYSYLTEESSRVSEAIRKLKTQVDKEFDFGHLKTIVIGESLIQKDIGEVIDIFSRRRDFQRISWVSVGKPSAEKVLKAEPKSEMAASVSLFNFFSNTGVESPYIVSTYLFDLCRKIYEQGIDPILPVIETDKEATKLSINHAIVLDDKKIGLELTPRQTKLLNILRNRLNKMEVLIKKEDYEFMISIDSLQSKFKIETPEGQDPVIKLKVDMSGIIEESDRYTNAKEVEHLSKVASKDVEMWLKELLTLFKEKNVDPVGFGLRYRATRLQHQDQTKTWEKELYPNLEFDVTVNVGIKSTGIVE